MGAVKQKSNRIAQLSLAIPGYKGYTTWKNACETDTAFSEELLSRLSDITGHARRMKRLCNELACHDLGSLFDEMIKYTERLARIVGDITPQRRAISEVTDSRKSTEITELDYRILEKIGNINQSLSMLELEEATGLVSEDIEPIIELLNDLESSVLERANLIGGRSS